VFCLLKHYAKAAEDKLAMLFLSGKNWCGYFQVETNASFSSIFSDLL